MIKCIVLVPQHNHAPKEVEVMATSLFDAARQAVDRLAKLAEFNSEPPIVVRANGKEYRVSQSRLCRWSHEQYEAEARARYLEKKALEEQNRLFPSTPEAY